VATIRSGRDAGPIRFTRSKKDVRLQHLHIPQRLKLIAREDYSLLIPRGTWMFHLSPPRFFVALFAPHLKSSLVLVAFETATATVALLALGVPWAWWTASGRGSRVGSRRGAAFEWSRRLLDPPIIPPSRPEEFHLRVDRRGLQASRRARRCRGKPLPSVVTPRLRHVPAANPTRAPRAGVVNGWPLGDRG
jgi:hypothetical protein